MFPGEKMKARFAAFLVAHSKLILVIFIILALCCGMLIPFVHVNEDMTKYLPKDSSMRHGLDLMEAEFGEESSSNLLVMFGDLRNAKEKAQVLHDLEEIPNVESVDYESGDEDYNRGQYTLYIVNSDSEQYSDEASVIWETVRDTYGESHDLTLGGSINDANVEGLPLWITATAVGLIFLILMIMASSWIEPVAFLITIGVAVLINMGTYILFPSISKTSFGIVAILQLALSMDYSIMLLNRYRQQRQVTADKRQAMRDSLSLSFGAITGSSLTTFAGLLALVFMSFTMGADIGLALAKGVIISLLCIFTVLPALLLGFDDLMLRTAKKTLPFDHPKLSRFQFRMRVPITLLFLALFVAGFFARSGVDFSYSQGQETDIDKVFGYENSIVMVYDDQDHKAAASLAEALDEKDVVRSAVCYESTLGKRRTAEDMRSFIEDMEDNEGPDEDQNEELDEDMIRLIYYDHYASDADLKLTIPQFVGYLQNDVLGDEQFGSSVSQESRDQIDDMEKFTDASSLTRQRGAGGLASFFGMKKSDAGQLLLYQKIKSGAGGGAMTVPGFVNFLINEVASDSDYGSMLDAKSLKQLKSLQVYTKKGTMTKPRIYRSAAKILGMSKSRMRMIYVNRLAAQMAKSAGGGDDSGSTGGVPQLNGSTGGVPQFSGSTMSIAELATVLDQMLRDPALKDQFGDENQKLQMQQLVAGLQQIGMMDPGSYEMTGMLQALAGYGIEIDPQLLGLAYPYHMVRDYPKEHLLSVQKLVHYMLSDKGIRSSMSKKQRSQFTTLKKVIDASVKKKHLSPTRMAGLLGMNSSDARSVYLLHQYRHGDTSSWTMSPQQFINFLVGSVLTDPKMSGRVGGSADDLRLAQKIINNVVAGTAFTSKELADLLGDRSGDMSEDDLALVYELYGSENKYDESWTMDLMGMVHHLTDKMLDRPAFASAMDEDQRADAEEMRADLDEAAELLEGAHYGRMMITADLPEDSDETRAFMDDLTAYTDANFKGDTYLIGSTPMAYEMSQSFHAELNRLTLITALFILFIVLLTFRRLATPVILVLMIQCAVFLTMGAMTAVHYDMNYLALLIVQSLMMGATIDYAIIYSSYYVEKRKELSPVEAIRASFKGSLQTILTSATILIAAVGVLSFAFSEPATRQICRILSLGCLIATLLVIFLLPGILSCLDRWVVKRPAR